MNTKAAYSSNQCRCFQGVVCDFTRSSTRYTCFARKLVIVIQFFVFCSPQQYLCNYFNTSLIATDFKLQITFKRHEVENKFEIRTRLIRERSLKK